MRCTSALIFLCSLCTAPLAFAQSQAEVQALLAQQHTLAASFTQEKEIAQLHHTLRSSGVMLMSKEHGIVWQQQKPFTLKLILTDEHMVQIVNHGKALVLTKTENAQVFEFASLLRSLFDLKQETLEELFVISFTDKKEDGFTIDLEPRHSPLNKIFEHIQLQGRDFVEEVQIFDRLKDVTTIRFSDHRPLEQLSAAELKLYQYEE